jgi:Domain of unknown function (DUF4389)
MTPTYPARLDGRIEEPINRWLWLVKWALLIPHFLCLAGLWIAMSVLTVVAGLSILFTARYPRAIFDFNVGVIRWTWRVGFYAINAFGTDRYPPFSLKSDPQYPADFHVEYPERLSRGLVLVKWWLLAIPQYLVVAVLAGGWGFNANGAWRLTGGGGVIALLALAGAVVVAVTGSYPRQLFDVTMGLNRWCYRVLAYAALMRDEYPPFRFDGGGADPGTPPPDPGELPLAA